MSTISATPGINTQTRNPTTPTHTSKTRSSSVSRIPIRPASPTPSLPKTPTPASPTRLTTELVDPNVVAALFPHRAHRRTLSSPGDHVQKPGVIPPVTKSTERPRPGRLTTTASSTLSVRANSALSVKTRSPGVISPVKKSASPVSKVALPKNSRITPGVTREQPLKSPSSISSQSRVEALRPPSSGSNSVAQDDLAAKQWSDREHAFAAEVQSYELHFAELERQSALERQTKAEEIDRLQHLLQNATDELTDRRNADGSHETDEASPETYRLSTHILALQHSLQEMEAVAARNQAGLSWLYEKNQQQQNQNESFHDYELQICEKALTRMLESESRNKEVISQLTKDLAHARSEDPQGNNLAKIQMLAAQLAEADILAQELHKKVAELEALRETDRHNVDSRSTIEAKEGQKRDEEASRKISELESALARYQEEIKDLCSFDNDQTVMDEYDAEHSDTPLHLLKTFFSRVRHRAVELENENTASRENETRVRQEAAALRTQVEQYARDLELVQDQLVKTDTRNLQLQIDLDGLQQQNTALEQLAKDTRESLVQSEDKLRTTIEELTSPDAASEAAKAELLQKIEDLEDQLMQESKWRTEIGDSEKVVAHEKDLEIQELQNTLISHESKVKNSKAIAEEQALLLSQREAQIAELHNKLESVQEQFTHSEMSAAQNHQAQIAELQSKLESVQQQFNHSEMSAAQHHQAFLQQESAVLALRDQVGLMQTQIQEYESRINQDQSNVEHKTTIISKLENKLQITLQELEQIKISAQSQNDMLRVECDKSAEYERQLVSLQNEIAELQVALTTHQQTDKESTEQIISLQAELEEARRQANELKTGESLITEQSAHIASQKRTIEELSGRIRNHEADLTKLRNQLAAKDQDHKSILATTAEIEKQLLSESGTAEQLTFEIQSLTTKVQALELELSLRDAELSRLQAESTQNLGRLQEIADLDRRIETLTAAHEKSVAAVEAELKKSTALAETLESERGENAALIQNLQKATITLQTSEGKLKRALEAVAEKNQEIACLSSEIQSLRVEFSMQVSSQASQKERAAADRLILEDRESTIEVLTTELESTRALLTTGSAVSVEQSEQLQQAVLEINNRNETIKKLTHTVDELRKAVANLEANRDKFREKEANIQRESKQMISSKDAEVALLNSRLEMAQSVMKERAKELTVHAKYLEEKDQRIQRLETDIKNLKDSLRNTAAQSSKESSSIEDALRAEVERSKKTISSLERQKMAEAEQVMILNASDKMKDNQIARLRAQEEEHRSVMALKEKEYRQTLVSKDQELAKHGAVAADVDQEIYRRDATIESLTGNLEAMRAALAARDETLATLGSRQIGDDASAAVLAATLHEELDKFRAELVEAQSTMDRLRSERNHYRSGLAQELQAREDMERERLRWSQEREVLAQEGVALREKLKRMTESDQGHNTPSKQAKSSVTEPESPHSPHSIPLGDVSVSSAHTIDSSRIDVLARENQGLHALVASLKADKAHLEHDLKMERNALEVTHHELQRARSVESITKTTGHDASSLLDKQPQEESRTLTAASHHQEKHLPQLPKATHQALADSRAGQSSLKVLSPPLGSPKRGASTTSLWSSDDTSSDNGSPAEDDPNDVPSIIIPLRTPKSPSRGLSQSRRSPSRDTSYSRQSPSRDSEEWIHHQEALKLRRASPRRPSVPIPELQGQEPQFPHSLNARNHIEYALIYLDQAPLATAQFPAVRRALEILERALQEVEGQQQIPSDSENGGKQGGQATPETRSIPVNSLQSVFT